MVTTDNGASLEAAAPGPALLSPFSSTPLFSAAGRKEVNNMPADLRKIVVCKDRGRSGLPVSPVGSAPSLRSDLERLREEGHLCSPVSSAVKAAISLLPDEPTKKHRLAPRCLGVTQNIRSKAQILALLRSKPASMSEEMDSEMSGHVPRVQPQGSLQTPTKPKCFVEQGMGAAERTESLQCQRPSESTGSSDSWWAVYLSSQPSPAHSSTVASDEVERKPQAQGNDVNLNLRDFLGQKRIQLFETGAENVEKFNGDKLIDDSSWDQEVKLEIPSFSGSLPVTCSNLGKDGLVSGSDIQGNIQMPINQNDEVCVKRFVLTRENAQEIDTCGTPAREYKQALSHMPESEHLQLESSLSDSSKISEAVPDTFSRANTDSESLSIHGPRSNVTQPVLEVNFNLNNFETSDTEEESQQRNKMSQDSEDWEREALADVCSSGVQRCEGVRCEDDGASLPLLTPIAGKPTEPFPTPETLLSQLCGIAGPIGDEVAGGSDSTVGWTDDVHSGNEALNSPIQKARNNCNFASLLNKSKGINSNLYIPNFLNIDTNQTPKSILFSEQTQYQPFFMGYDLDTNDEQVLMSTSGSDDSIQRLNSNQSHFDECIALVKSNPQISNSLFYSLGRKHPISKDIRAHNPESEDLGGIPSLPHDHVEVDTAGASRQYWNCPRNSSELSELVNNISLLKSLSEHSTALEGLEVLKKKNSAFKQQGTLEILPESSPKG